MTEPSGGRSVFGVATYCLPSPGQEISHISRKLLMPTGRPKWKAQLLCPRKTCLPLIPWLIFRCGDGAFERGKNTFPLPPSNNLSSWLWRNACFQQFPALGLKANEKRRAVSGRADYRLKTCPGVNLLDLDFQTCLGSGSGFPGRINQDGLSERLLLFRSLLVFCTI